MNVLEIGCDVGIITCFIASLRPEIKITAIDSSKKSIRYSIKDLSRNETGKLAIFESSKYTNKIITAVYVEEIMDFNYGYRNLIDLDHEMKELDKIVQIINDHEAGKFLYIERIKVD